MTPEIVNIVIIVGAIAFAFYGFSVGIIHQLGSVAGLAVGFIASRFLGPGVSSALHVDPLICSALVFALFFLATGILVRVIKGTVHLAFLGSIDKILGAVMGIINWLLLTSLLLNLLVHYKPDTDLVSGKISMFALDFLPSIIGVAQDYIATNG